MLANCGQLGLDPAALSVSGYLEALAAHNSAGEPEKREPGELADINRLKRFKAARTSEG